MNESSHLNPSRTPTRPGISAFAENPEDVGSSLDPLFSFAKEVLAGKEHQFKYFPVYLKATGERSVGLFMLGVG